MVRGPTHSACFEAILTFELGRTMLGPEWERTEREKAVSNVLEEVAADVGASNIQAGQSRSFQYFRCRKLNRFQCSQWLLRM